MNSIPENLERLHAGEESIRTTSLVAIRSDEDLARHIDLIERSMDLLNLFSEKPTHREDEDHQTIRLLGIRLFNGCAAALRLLVAGYYQNATMLMRDLFETVFLLGYLRHKPDQIAAWREADKITRLKKFGPAKIRIALDERDGFTKKRREATYNLLCELAAHPTHMGFRMLAPQGQDHHCGPFFDARLLEALIGELVTVAIQAAQNYVLFFKSDSKAKMLAQLEYMEAVGEWAERYFKRPLDRKNIDEMRSLLAKLEQHANQ